MKKNKGFTLVEVIVILVILAILAAVLIPSLTTYIDKAKEKSITANARAAFVATQALASENYGLGTENKANDTPKLADIIALAQLGDVNAKETITLTYTFGEKSENGNIKTFSYKQGDKTATWTPGTGAWVVS